MNPADLKMVRSDNDVAYDIEACGSSDESGSEGGMAANIIEEPLVDRSPFMPKVETEAADDGE